MREINEIWRDISGYEGIYQVSNFGRVKSVERVDCNNHTVKKRIFKPGKQTSGYLQVGLWKNGKGKIYLVHRLVANAFLPNPNNLPEINHIDEDKTNNKVDNLEWCDRTYNNRYSRAKAVNQYTKDGRFIRTWNCMSDIKHQLGFKLSAICNCCRGNRKSASGYQWFYSNDPLQPEPPLF